MPKHAKKPSAEEREYQKIVKSFRLASAAAVIILAIGMVFYHFVQDLSWVDALYFCVVTLTTIGYGDITPVTNFEKLFTVFYILAGVGIIATFANLFVKRAVAKRMLNK
jgi:hypothetical protein